MTSFANAFGSSDHEQGYSNNIENGLFNNINNQQGSNHFSSIDLDQQLTASKEQHSSYMKLNDAATFQTDSSSTAGAIPNLLPSSPVLSSKDLSASRIECFSKFCKLIYS
jgi:hypothetical protein